MKKYITFTVKWCSRSRYSKLICTKITIVYRPFLLHLSQRLKSRLIIGQKSQKCLILQVHFEKKSTFKITLDDLLRTWAFVGPFGIKFTVDHQPKNWGKCSILWSRLGKKNRLSLENLWDLLGSKSTIKITLDYRTKKWENASYYICVLRKTSRDLVYLWHLLGSKSYLIIEQKSGRIKITLYYWPKKMVGNAWYYSPVLRKKLSFGVGSKSHLLIRQKSWKIAMGGLEFLGNLLEQNHNWSSVSKKKKLTFEGWGGVLEDFAAPFGIKIEHDYRPTKSKKCLIL